MADDDFTKVFKALQKDLGVGNVCLLSDEEYVTANIPYTCSTGSMVLDSLTLNGDDEDDTLIPFGRIVTVTGLPKLGKTTLVASAVRALQQADKSVNGNEPFIGVIDSENAISTAWWSRNQVDIKKVVILPLRSKHNTIANAARGIRKLVDMRNKVNPKMPMIAVWDSLGLSSSDTQVSNLYDKEVGDDADQTYGSAKELGDYLRPLKDLIAENNVCLYIVNHLMSDLKTGQLQAFGGKKLQHVETIHYRLKKPAQKWRLEITHKGKTKRFGQQVEVTTFFNKLHPPSFEGHRITIIFDEGISDHYAVYDTLKDKKWATPSGEELTWVNYLAFRKKVCTHPEYLFLLNKVRQEVYGLDPTDKVPPLPKSVINPKPKAA
jgi:RecA/RadA recombinase